MNKYQRLNEAWREALTIEALIESALERHNFRVVSGNPDAELTRALGVALNAARRNQERAHKALMGIKNEA